MLKRITMITVVAALMLTQIGCSAATTAERTQSVLQAVIAVAQAETPAIPIQDQPKYTAFTNLASTLDGQLGTCITNVTGTAGTAMNTKSKFLTCFNTFTSGLLTSPELAQLQISDSKTQQEVQLYVTAIVQGVNIALTFFGGSPAVTPTVGTKATAIRLNDLRIRVNDLLPIGQGI